MANSNAKSNATVSVDSQIHVGKATFTLTQALEHGAAMYDQLYLLQSSTLDCYNELGLILIQTRALYKSDKLFGQFLGKSPLEYQPSGSVLSPRQSLMLLNQQAMYPKAMLSLRLRLLMDHPSLRLRQSLLRLTTLRPS